MTDMDDGDVKEPASKRAKLCKSTNCKHIPPTGLPLVSLAPWSRVCRFHAKDWSRVVCRAAVLNPGSSGLSFALLLRPIQRTPTRRPPPRAMPTACAGSSNEPTLKSSTMLLPTATGATAIR
jgi:hypothetical protein